jgi:hypothetical protein
VKKKGSPTKEIQIDEGSRRRLPDMETHPKDRQRPEEQVARGRTILSPEVIIYLAKFIEEQEWVKCVKSRTAKGKRCG